MFCLFHLIFLRHAVVAVFFVYPLLIPIALSTFCGCGRFLHVLWIYITLHSVFGLCFSHGNETGRVLWPQVNQSFKTFSWQLDTRVFWFYNTWHHFLSIFDSHFKTQMTKIAWWYCLPVHTTFSGLCLVFKVIAAKWNVVFLRKFDTDLTSLEISKRERERILTSW